MEKNRRKTYDLPEVKIKSIKRETIEAFKSARDSRSLLGIAGDPLLTDRALSRSGRIAAPGYTGYRPQHEEKDPFEENLSFSPIKSQRIRGYTGYIPGSRTNIGSAMSLGTEPVILDESMSNMKSFKLLKLQSSNNFTESDMPACKYKKRPDDAAGEKALRYIRPGHADFITARYGSLENMQNHYANSIRRIEESGQTQEGLLTLVQSKLSERVTSYAEQIIRTRNLFKYFDFDDSNTLDEREFERFLEMVNCHLEDHQRVAVFAYMDKDMKGGISWKDFQTHCTVPNPKGGTAVLPKSITRTHSIATL